MIMSSIKKKKLGQVVYLFIPHDLIYIGISTSEACSQKCRFDGTYPCIMHATYKISANCSEREREIEFYFTPAKPGCGHISEGGMSLRLRGESKVQARRPSIYQLYSYLYKNAFVSKSLNIERTSMQTLLAPLGYLVTCNVTCS